MAVFVAVVVELVFALLSEDVEAEPEQAASASVKTSSAQRGRSDGFLSIGDRPPGQGKALDS